jgi:hypothetical protein
MLDDLACAVHTPGVDRARVGRGQNTIMQRFLERLAAPAGHLGWRVEAGGRVVFTPDEAAPR